LTEVSPQPDDTDARIRGSQFGQDTKGAIAAPVIDEHDFPRTVAEGLAEPLV
jgi:hypothetical protein